MADESRASEAARRFRASDVQILRRYEVECDDCDRVITDVAQGVESVNEAMRIRRQHIEDHRAGRIDA